MRFSSSSARSHGRHRPDAHDLRIHPGGSHLADDGERLELVLLREVLVHQEERAQPRPWIPEEFPAVTVPFAASKTGASFASAAKVVSARGSVL
jgi:hypothetical protein